MRWIRNHIPWATRLALFALTVQLAVSFGHVHADAIAAALKAVTGAPGDRIDSAASVVSLPPVQPGHSAPAYDYCAICANISLLNSLAFPVSATLLHPRQSDWVRYDYVAARELPAQPRYSASARAPPSA
jgi:hypothetical protein